MRLTPHVELLPLHSGRRLSAAMSVVTRVTCQSKGMKCRSRNFGCNVYGRRLSEEATVFETCVAAVAFQTVACFQSCETILGSETLLIF